MPSDQTERKKKRKKAKKPKKNQNLNSYVRISGDEEEAFVPSAEDGIESKPKPVVPYPEAEDAPQLTANGNSLPNTPRHHKRPTGVGANGARLCNTCAARTCGWCNYNRLVWILVSSVFCIFLFIAGVSYEDHHLRNTDPPVVHDGNAEQDTSKGTNDDVPSGGFGSDPSTYSQRQRHLMTKMRQLSGSVVLTPNTPQNKAANWILWEDASGISADSAFLWQVSIHFTTKPSANFISHFETISYPFASDRDTSQPYSIIKWETTINISNLTRIPLNAHGNVLVVIQMVTSSISDLIIVT